MFVPFLYIFYNENELLSNKTNLTLSDPLFQPLFTYDLYKLCCNFPKEGVPSHGVLQHSLSIKLIKYLWKPTCVVDVVAVVIVLYTRLIFLAIPSAPKRPELDIHAFVFAIKDLVINMCLGNWTIIMRLYVFIKLLEILCEKNLTNARRSRMMMSFYLRKEMETHGLQIRLVYVRAKTKTQLYKPLVLLSPSCVRNSNYTAHCGDCYRNDTQRLMPPNIYAFV